MRCRGSRILPLLALLVVRRIRVLAHPVLRMGIALCGRVRVALAVIVSVRGLLGLVVWRRRPVRLLRRVR